MDMSTPVAGLAGWIERVYPHHLYGFVVELSPNLAERCIGYRSRQGMVFEHSCHIERFQGYDAGFACQVRGQLVHCIGSQVGNPQVQSRQFLLRFLPVAAALLLAS
jgi:hypothetical protein